MLNKKIAIVVSHMDDEVFGMGGTLLKLSKHNQILIVSFCHGMNGFDEKRFESFIEVISKVNAKYDLYDYDDVTLELASTLKLTNKLDNTLKEFNPDIVFTHSKDCHPDHVIVSDVVDVLSRRGRFQGVYKFTIPGNNEWTDNNFKPSLYIDITSEFKDKLKLIRYYREYQYPDPLSPKKIKYHDEYIGSIINKKKAECFEIHQEIK